MNKTNRYLTGQVLILENNSSTYSLNKFSKSNEIKKIDYAIKAAKKELENLKKISPVEMKEIISTHIFGLEDKFIVNEIKEYINKKNKSAYIATLNVFEKYEELSTSKKRYFNKKRNRLDIIDIKTRIIKHLEHKSKDTLSSFKNKIIIKKRILPSEIIELKNKDILAIVVEDDCEFGHIAIAIESSNIPILMGIKNAMKIKNNSLITIDTFTKKILNKKKNNTFKSNNGVVKTNDNNVINIYLNINISSEIKNGIDDKFGGIGLYRSEFYYLNKSKLPSENELFNEYKFLFKNAKCKEVFFRLLDFGWDKTPKYLKLSKNEQSSLGIRGIRFFKVNKSLFVSQISALLKSYGNNKLSIIIPMVSTKDEIIAIKKAIVDIGRKLNINIKNIKIGIMVETPAAAIVIDKLIDLVDFVSIGTNDLMQYTMACDRNLSSLSYLYQMPNIAILRIIKLVIDICKKKNKKLCICGEMANQINSLPLLIGLGIKNISIPAKYFDRVNWLITSVSFKECKKLVNKILNENSNKDASLVLSKYLKNKNLL